MATETESGPGVSVAENQLSASSEEAGGRFQSPDRTDFPVPGHILGRTVDDPAADVVGSVKPYQKPRLGVKVPYMNLTSQIVSQDEIAAELAERAERAQKNNPPGTIDGSKTGDMLFTMKMTHRLVKSIKPTFPEKNLGADQQSIESPAPSTPTPATAPSPASVPAPAQPETGGGASSPEKHDANSLHSQLMKTLEDENALDPTLNSLSNQDSKVPKRAAGKSKVHVKLDRELERQLALQQLQEFNMQKQIRKELKEKSKEELKEKSKEQQLKPKIKRNRKNIKLKNIVINRKLDETEAPILPYKSIQRKHKVTIGVVPVNGAEASARVTANENDVTEAPPEIPDIKIAKDKHYMKKYSNKRHSEDAMNGSNEIIDEIASEILDPTPKKKRKKAKLVSNTPVPVEETGTPGPEGSSPGKRKSTRKIKPTEKVAQKKQKLLKGIKAAPAQPEPVENGTPSASDGAAAVPEDEEPQVDANGSMQVETNTNESGETQDVPPDASSDPTATAEGGKKSRMMREIDRLLMDEGAINMLYSIEEKRSPKNSNQKANLLPSARRKKRDLVLKTKLVKSAVLKLSGSPKDANRSQRQSQKQNEVETDEARKASVDSQESVPGASPKPSSSSLPAEASRIIRRHSSSSSFSSAAGSPRRMSTDFEHPPPNLTPDGVSVSGKKLKKKNVNKVKKALSPKKDASAVSNTQQVKSLPNQSAPPKMSSPVKEDVRSEMSKNFNKKASSPKNVIRKTLYAEEKSLNTSAAVATASSSAMPPPSVQRTTPAAPISTAPAKTSTPQQPVNAIHQRKSSSLFLENLASREFNDKLERLDTQQPRVGPTTSALPKVDCYQEITVQKMKDQHLMHIVLTPNPAKIKNALNVRVIRELIAAIQTANADKGIRAVLITSIGTTFCQGIDFESLIEDDVERRKTVVVELAIAIRDFIHGLGMFNKLLIAGVHGPAVGLGVMMLPYFDMVFASDKATFYTPYTKLGQIPEGAPALTMSHMLSNAATSELIYGCRQLTASEALRCGLVTRILWPDRFQEELLPIVTEISSHSAQAMEATKTLMRKEMRAQLNMALAAECHLLVKNWNTPECQENFKKFLRDESLWQITK
nr:PREDICTED: serine/arginine repetitive matrix protein 1 [Bemisia tabaci]XP_018909036.1 PREDICTED: serine/arginine repetitive matrix protein 1 [Bemisia tabaci]